MLTMSMIATRIEESSGTVPDPPRSTQASVNNAKMKVAENAPSE